MTLILHTRRAEKKGTGTAEVVDYRPSGLAWLVSSRQRRSRLGTRRQFGAWFDQAPAPNENQS